MTVGDGVTVWPELDYAWRAVQQGIALRLGGGLLPYVYVRLCGHLCRLSGFPAEPLSTLCCACTPVEVPESCPICCAR